MGFTPLHVQADEKPMSPPLPGVGAPQAGKVSLGVSVMKPSTELYSQLPKLPKGSGFLLRNVVSGGTADMAGLKPMDLIWKLDNQLIINESQLMVLLSHQKPGDKVKLSYFRSGEAKEAVIELQPWVAQAPPLPDMLAFSSSPPAVPIRVISYENRSASISDKTGTATLTYREGKPWLHVESNQGVETFNSFVSEKSEIAHVPAIWRSRLPVLQRSLEESIRLRRLPRVRYVPRANTKGSVAGSE
jgi:hypothetical protein